MSSFNILAIETSCDETSIAILRIENEKISILSNRISSQISLHSQWGGVVPNLAAREHTKNIPLVLSEALSETEITLEQIDLISVTNGPGLIPALLVGVNFAKTLAYLLEKPLLGIHHIEGHIYANFIFDKVGSISNFQFPISKQISKSKCQNKKTSLNEDCKLKIENSTSISFPALVLVVSGGHTQLVLMKNHLEYELIGQTLDDAVGEAFDKVARILNIGYPGGPAVSALAETASNKLQVTSNKKYDIEFPRPMLHSKNFDFSFSGLKTAVLYETKKNPYLLKDKDYVAEICHEFQQACIDVLVSKTIKAAEQFKPKTILLAGGVSANTELRKRLGKIVQESMPNTIYQIPNTDLTGDNAAMIGAAAHFRWQKMTAKEHQIALKNWQNLQTDANLKLR